MIRNHAQRHARRRNETRTKLIRAARALIARQGVEAVRINEITEEADVGFGSFYNHFKSKDDIVEAVLRETIAEQAGAVDAVTAGIEDPAEIVAVGHRHFVERARADSEFGRLLIRLDDVHNVANPAFSRFAERHLEAGIKAGRFSVPNKRVALVGAAGALLATMRDVVDGRAPKDAARLHAEGVLRLFGLSREEAAEVARRPMPAVATPRG